MGLHVQDNGMSLSDWHKLNEGKDNEIDDSKDREIQLLEAKVKASNERMDFLEELIAELAMKVY